MIHRREWLQQAGVAGALFGLGRAAKAQQAPMAAASDYKALVCVFLFGGNDGNNMVVPLGDAYADYAKARSASGLAISPDQLVALAEEGGTARHGLHPALRPLEPLWAKQRLALQFNTGPLVEPITRAGYLKAAARPDNLFSHADQQEFAQALPRGAGTQGGTGWGFRLAREAGFGGPRLPSLVSFSGNQRFLQGDVRRSLVLPARGNFGLNGTGSGTGTDPVASARLAAFRTMWAGSASPIGAQAGVIVDSALSAAGFVNPILNAASPASSEPFATQKSDISQQLLRVARLIEARESIGNPRQVFFVSMGGYDTHVNQRNEQDRLLGELAAALKAFHDATEALGVAEQVTTFTLSDFARTLKVNTGGGTDHGWGNHHLVIGGAVRGQRSYGVFPTLAAGGPDDAGNEGRWIPTTAYDQYVATLARWFGAGPDALREIAPNLARFGAADLGFMA
jgi:uncharacterized protein (DUF1501 family)